MKYETALEAANILYEIESLDDLNDRLKQLRLNLEYEAGENIIIKENKKINEKQEKKKKKIEKL